MDGSEDDDPIFYCYSRRRADDAVRAFRVDPATALVLGAVDGRRSVSEVAGAAGLARGSEPLVESVLDAAAGLELVEPAVRLPLTDLLAGYFATRTLYVLHRTGVLDALGSPAASAEVARSLHLDPTWLEGCLDFLATQTDLVERVDGGRFRAHADADVAFALEKFVGAYGPCLDEAGPAPERVDGDTLAGAFVRVAGAGGSGPLASILAEWDVGACVLDIGCGPASVLVGLATANPGFTGIGIDASAAMCAAARDAADRRGVAAQLTIVEGDALDVLASMTPEERRPVTAVYARSFFNACFGAGPDGATGAVATLGRLLPGRLLVVDDYYGELGRRPATPRADHRAAVVQDLVQVWSGQGVPPGDLDGWAAVYAAGGARLGRAYEDTLDGFRRFVHVVTLGSADG